MIYTFKEGVYEGQKSLTIESDANYTYKDPRQPQDFEIKSKTTSIVNANSWKPLYSYFKMEWKGTMNGFNETESKYGEKNVSWTNKYPNGSYSKEVKFYEEFHDEDSVMWFTPTLGYEKTNRDCSHILPIAQQNQHRHDMDGWNWRSGARNMMPGLLE